MWPPNSPDLSPVDYAVWGALQQQVYHNRKFTTADQLKHGIVEEWNKLSRQFIDRSIDEWRRRLIVGLYSSRVDTFSVRITWKPEYAGPPHLFSLPHKAHGVVENLGTEGLHTYFL